MEEVSLKALLEAGCHFGHKAERWHPKAAKFIYQKRDGIHIIDLVQTKGALEKASEFVKQQAREGKQVLFMGTKRQAAATIKAEAEKVGAPYISVRWIGGFLTNWEQVHKNLEKIRRLKEEETAGSWNKFPKHERVKLGRYLRKLEHFYGGVIALLDPPSTIVVVDIKREEVAVREAKRMNVPIVAIVDTNSDPTLIDLPVPANDDAVGSIEYIIRYLAEAYREGKEELVKKEAKEAKELEMKKPGAEENKFEEKLAEVKKVEKEVKAETITEPKKKQGPPEKTETTPVVTQPAEKEEKPKKRGRPKKMKSEIPNSKSETNAYK